MDFKASANAQRVITENRKTADKRTDTFAEFRFKAQQERNKIRNTVDHAEAERERIRKRYSADVQKEKLTELEINMAEQITSAKNNLRTELKKIVEAKREALKNYVSVPMTADQISTLSGLKMRKNIPAEELTMHLANMANSYQALSILHDICEENGLTFTMPVDFSTSADDLTRAETMCSSMIDCVGDKELGYMGYEFYNFDNVDGAFKYAFSKIDDNPAFDNAVPMEHKTVLQKLQEAKEHVFDGAENKFDEYKAYKKSMEIRKFIDEHKEDLQEDADILTAKEEVRNEAIRLFDLPTD